VSDDRTAAGDASAAAAPVLLITGASSGLGEATARLAHERGWRLVLASRSLDRLEQLAGELGGPERTVAQRCDVTSWDDQQAAVAAALERFGRLDAAWANAGFGGQRTFLGDTVEHWREMVLTNVYGAALTIRATMPALRESRGHLLLTGSVAGRRPIVGSLYSATKFAVHAMAESARQELAGSGVRVTVIAPGMTDTAFFATRPLTLQDPLVPEDVARAVLWALEQPPHANVNEILIRPTSQEL
jgi:NADP-dependent 3-hydroxy acid dehydrogenase YdfG